MTLEQVFGLVRHILTIVGVILVMKGAQVDDGNWQMLTGAILGLAATLWSVFSKPTPPTTPTPIV